MRTECCDMAQVPAECSDNCVHNNPSALTCIDTNGATLFQKLPSNDTLIIPTEVHVDALIIATEVHICATWCYAMKTA